jgi:hypothetical protein
MLFHSVWENSVDGMRLTDERKNCGGQQRLCRLVCMEEPNWKGSR